MVEEGEDRPFRFFVYLTWCSQEDANEKSNAMDECAEEVNETI